MSKAVRQASDLTQIRRLIEQSFTKDPHDIDLLLYDFIERIELAPGQEIIYNEETKWYQVLTHPQCKICNATQALKEILTQSSKFYLCPGCYYDIVRAKEDS